ncbi:MAG: hypothetical protein ACREHC_02400, partial [Candidatus Levyibacteriota bacterium]
MTGRESEYRINGETHPHQRGMLFRGQFCEPLYFTPRPSSGYKIIEKRSDIAPEVSTVLDKMVSVFRGDSTASEPFWQLPRQGRRCFLPVASSGEGFVTPKGSLGQSPGSENFRRMMEKQLQSAYGNKGGFIRSEFDEGADFLVFYKPNEHGKGVEITWASPEG